MANLQEPSSLSVRMAKWLEYKNYLTVGMYDEIFVSTKLWLDMDLKT